MAHNQLSRAWRVAYAVVGLAFFIIGAAGTVADLYWLMMHRHRKALPAAIVMAAITAVGGYLLHVARRGRNRALGL